MIQAYDDPDDPMLGSRATKALASVVATLSFYAVHVHVMFGLVFIVDFSVAAAVYPVGALLYALVCSPSSKFWQALLIYTEGLLLVQYVFQVALRAGCISLETDAMRIAYRLGLHSSAVRLRSPALALAVLRVPYLESCFEACELQCLCLHFGHCLLQSPLSMCRAPYRCAPYHCSSLTSCF